MSESQSQASSVDGLRIHYFSASTLPSRTANSVHVMKMCNAFAYNSCDITLFARSDGVKPSKIFAYYGIESSFDLVLSPSSGSRLLSLLLRLDCYRRAINTLPTPDLIYGRDVLSLWLFAHRRSKRFIFEAHHPPTCRLQATLMKALMSSLHLEAVVTISKRLRCDWLKRYPNLRADRVHVAHDGADCPEPENKIFASRVRPARAQIGYVGSLYEGRGIEVIMALAERLTEVDFHLVGGSPDEVEAWCARGVPVNVSFHGHMPHCEIPSWLASFDILLAPYQPGVRIAKGLDTTDCMSPLKLFEYMASNRPLVGSNLPALREVLEHDRNCLLVDPADISAWCYAIMSLLRDSARAERLAEEARADLVKEYSWQKRAHKILRSFL